MSDWKSRATVVSNGTNDWRSRAIGASGKAILNDYADKLQPQQEMPDWLSAKDRMIAKNLAQSPQKQMEYLKLQYPGKEFAVNANSQVLARDPGSKQWKVLDPDTGFFSDPAEFAKDAGDILYDIPAGIAQGAATTLGAAGGTIAAAPGVGTMAGAMAAGGAAGGGLEAFRQKLGQQLGIPQDVDMKQVGTSAVAGAISPLVFGAGKAGQSAIQAVAENMNIPAEEAAKLIESQGRGLLERGYDWATRKAAPAVLSAATGVDSDAIKYYGSNIDEMQKLKENGISETAQQLSDKVTGHIADQTAADGKAVAQAMADAQKLVDISEAKNNWKQKIAAAEANAVTPADQSYVDAMKAQYIKYFGLAKQEGAELPDQIDATKAFDVQKKLKAAARFDSNADTAQKYAQTEGARSASGDLNKAFSKATDGLSQEAKNKYSAMIDLGDQIEPKFKDAQTAINTSTGIETKGRTVLKEKLKKLADSGELDVTPEMQAIRAHNEFYGPEKKKPPLALAMSTIGGVIANKIDPTYSSTALGALLGAGAGAAMGSREMLEKLIKAGYTAEQAARMLQPSVGYGAVGNAMAPSAWQMMRPQEQSGQ